MTTHSDEEITVSVDQVSYRGKTFRNQNGSKCAVFRGIPFAQPPVGTNRFQKPQPYEPKPNSTVNCTEWAARCVQWSGTFCRYDGQVIDDSEDCLTLNIFVKQSQLDNSGSNQLHPVCVWIHGGANVQGSALQCGLQGVLDGLVQKDICVVSVQYRLGPLGFADFDHDELSANLALWDLTMALKWVQQNIRNFGGDPKRVTAGGWSAGARMVTMLALSPYSRDLFHQTIQLSGSGLRPARQSVVRQSTEQFLTNLNIPDQLTVKDKLKMLVHKPVEDLVAAYLRIDNAIPVPVTPLFPMGPTADPEFLESESSILDLLKGNGINRKPALLGTMSLELADLFHANMSISHSRMMRSINFVVNEAFGSNQDRRVRMAGLVAHHYLPDGIQSTDAQRLNAYTKLWSDYYYHGPVSGELKLRSGHRESGPVFAYQFSYVSDWLFPEDTVPEHRVSSHGNELPFLFGLPQTHKSRPEMRSFDREERTVAESFQTMVANFVTTGNPSTSSVTWFPSSAEHLDYLNFDGKENAMKVGFGGKQIFTEKFFNFV